MNARLLACTDGSPHGDVACDYSFLVGKVLKARVQGLHVLDIRMIEGPMLGDVSGMIGAGEYFAALPQFRQLAEDKGKAVSSAFVERARAAGLEATCEVESGHPVHTILDHESEADIMVLGLRGENEPFGRELVGSVTDRVIRRASKPCLITPSRFSPINHVLAACDDGPIAGKVTTMAAEWAVAMGKPLTIVSVADKTPLAHMRECAIEAEKLAAAKGAGVSAVVRSGVSADIILEVAADTQSGLIVMGAHSHTRIREWFVGCTTFRILADSALPALLVR
jgi:nucleotide-binding universal stress UspA family protein